MICLNYRRIWKLVMLVAICWILASCNGSSLKLYVGVSDSTASDSDNVWIVIERELLLHVTGSGNTRENKKFDGKDILNVYFLNSLVGWAMSTDNQIWKTSDGGRNWIGLGKLSSEEHGFGKQIIFENESDGWVIQLLSIWHTSDGGQTWKLVSPHLERDSNGNEPLKIFLTERGECIVGMTQGRILRTDDKGVSWQAINSPIGDDVSVMFFVENRGWVGNRSTGGLFFTNNKGTTWKQLLSDDLMQSVRIESIAFSDESTGWAAGRIHINQKDGKPEPVAAVLLKSTDGGLSWQVVNRELDDESFAKIIFLDSQKGLLIGKRHVYQSQDGGETWNLFSSL